jgi:class 3 adenylate cyclase
MGYIKDLDNKIKDYMDGDYEVVETKTIPSVQDVAFGKKAYKIKLTAFCIDLRKSTDLLRVHDKETCGKIHKSFLTIASKIITENGGQLRSFNGDSVLAFWPAQYKHQIESAVRTGFQLKWALTVKFAPYFKQYCTLDFGIGIDWGDVFIVRSGLPMNDNNNDLVFLGMSVNYANAIANQAHGPNHLEISTDTYNNLTDEWLIGTNGSGNKVNMWSNGTINWKGKVWNTKVTTWHSPVAD